MKNVLNVRGLALAVIASALACGGSTTETVATGTVAVTADATSINNDGTKARFTAKAKDAKGNVGTGTITFTALYGDVNGTGASTAITTADATGSAKVTYACSIATDSRCVAGSIVMIATWNGINGGAPIVINAGSTPPGTDGGGTPLTDGGTPVTDGGTPAATASKLTSVSVFPGFVIVSGAANVAQNLPPTATATFQVADQNGAAFPGATVSFAEAQGETLVTLGSTTAKSDASGLVTVTLTGNAKSGLAHVTASVPGAAPATITLPVLDGPSSILEVSAVPDVLGLKGSGIQENGLMTFKVTDSSGNAIGGVTVNFTQAQPNLVTVGHTSSTTDSTGLVAVDYSAGSEVGVTSITATVAASGASVSHTIAVRGAKPSAAGFYFKCEKVNLPVYTTTPRLETMTCEVRLSDRFGNRVGVATPVRFATEAGAIDAIATTKAFDPARPNDPTEGTATVTFTTDLGTGSTPADVAPLAAAPAQYPWPRAAEPQIASGSLVRNPRDQFVTIIAMTEGEEAFVDTNHNGVLDTNEVFYDLGDPFIDANDDNVFDAIYPGGPSEVRFCSNTSGNNCATYHGPNGTWDSLTTIWVPTWVVFSAAAAPYTTPAGGTPPASDYAPSCIGGGSAGISDIYVYDAFLNSPSSGTTFVAALDFASAVPNSLAVTAHGLGAELDQAGAMGLFGFDYDYRPVLPSGAACAAPASPAVPTACVMRLLFRDFDDGFRGQVQTQNTGPNACPSAAVFRSSVTVTNAHTVNVTGLQTGNFAP